MLPAQRDRIDSMFLLQKTWPIDEWRERYLDHPLVGTIARRLIWCVDGAPALFVNGQPTDVNGTPDRARRGRPRSRSGIPSGAAIDEITGVAAEARGAAESPSRSSRRIARSTC